MSGLIIFALLAAALLYGVFFLIFKLIWILFQNKRNLWPLILAGAATLLVMAAFIWAGFRVVNNVVRPFDPIITQFQTQTEPIYGEKEFVSDDGFQMTLYNGMTLSDWIKWPGLRALAGVDLNAKFEQQSAAQDAYFLGLLRLTQDKADTPQEMAETIVSAVENVNLDEGKIEIESFPESADVGPYGEASLMRLRIYAEQGENDEQPVSVLCSVLTAKRDEVSYYVAGCAFGDSPNAEASVKSFRFTQP